MIKIIPDGESFTGFVFIEGLNGNTGMDQHIVADFHFIKQCCGKLDLHAELLSLTVPGAELENFAAEVAVFYSGAQNTPETTTTRSLRRISPRATSFRRAARATPVWGQLNRPVRSACWAASTSSCSLACSTTPS